jgi:cyclohexyl-isocyanide hydratase
MRIGFILFPNVTQLDFTGPLQMLHRVPGATTHLLAKTLVPVPSDCGLGLVPNGTFADAPELDMICVPGGFGVGAAIQDAETLDFVRRAGGSARYVTSVCTGAFVLGAAGLLRGRHATTHWAYHHLLPLVGAIPQHERVVRDGNLFTGGGVTAGIDFALTVAAEIASPAIARRIQLATEYDPAPPFDAGTPDRAPTETSDEMKAFYAPRTAEFEQELATVLAAD